MEIGTTIVYKHPSWSVPMEGIILRISKDGLEGLVEWTAFICPTGRINMTVKPPTASWVTFADLAVQSLT